jgi:CHAT domain-containing protein/Tfp pilus assembly protein PilF
VAASASSAQVRPPDPLDPVRAALLQARFAGAEASARALLAETETRDGADSVAAARVMDALVEALWRGGKIRSPETRGLAERALAINESKLGSDHPDVGYSLTTLGHVLHLLGEYERAKSLLDRALTIEERALGPVHATVARTLTFAATLALDTGDLDRSLALHQRALAIRQQVLPPTDPAIGESFGGIGVVFERKGDATAAQRYDEQALAIRERALGPAHPDVATSLNNLANVKGDLGDYAAARSLHQRALAIREQALGPDHPDVAMSLNNLSIAIRDLGDRSAAWWPLERVVGIYEKIFGPQHLNVAIALQNLASLLVELDGADGARLLAERARRLRRGASESRFLASSLNGLSGVNPPFDSYQAARALLERALSLKESALGREHPSVAVTLTTLADVHVKLNARDTATAFYERALAIREKVLGPTHPSVADTLESLAVLRANAGDYAAARSMDERVLTIVEQTRGPEHPRAGTARQHLAEVRAALGDTDDAFAMALSAERIGREHLRLIGRTLPEREALSYAASRPVGIPLALTLLQRHPDEARRRSSAAWDAVVRSRAVVLDEMASRHRAVATEQIEVGALAEALSAKRAELAKLVVRGPEGSAEKHRLSLERARDERDTAERALAERSLAFRQERLQQQVGLSQVKAALPPESALIAFVRYTQDRFGELAIDRETKPSAAYLAFVARAGGNAEPAVVFLGDAAALDEDVARWRKEIGKVAFAGGRSTSGAEAAMREAGTRLRAKIWDPFAPHVAGAGRIFIVPDGSLHLVNWETLPTAGGRYLIEAAPLLHYLSAERDLVAADRADSAGRLVLVDNPAFDRQPVSDTARTSATFRGTRSNCADFGSMRFDPLPASAREATNILTIWRQRRGEGNDVRFSGTVATEGALKRGVAGARVLHLATHAFFLGGRCASPFGSGGDLRGAGAGAAVGENPLLLAGFAFTGANRRGAVGDDTEDGILTAEEVAALDLQGTEWAVLSACDTGVGEILAGEGVFGLRRAFQVAGARTVIMSLWPVDDEDTRRWMAAVYERRFARNLTTMEAVRESTLEQLGRRQRSGLSTHPFFWGGFIAAGDWR